MLVFPQCWLYALFAECLLRLFHRNKRRRRGQQPACRPHPRSRRRSLPPPRPIPPPHQVPRAQSPSSLRRVLKLRKTSGPWTLQHSNRLPSRSPLLLRVCVIHGSNAEPTRTVPWTHTATIIPIVNRCWYCRSRYCGRHTAGGACHRPGGYSPDPAHYAYRPLAARDFHGQHRGASRP